jgi:hypothetical protein
MPFASLKQAAWRSVCAFLEARAGQGLCFSRCLNEPANTIGSNARLANILCNLWTRCMHRFVLSHKGDVAGAANAARRCIQWRRQKAEWLKVQQCQEDVEFCLSGYPSMMGVRAMLHMQAVTRPGITVAALAVLLDQAAAQGQLAPSPAIPALTRYLAADIHKCTRQGEPLYIVRAGLRSV